MELKRVYKQTDRYWEGNHIIALRWCCFCHIKAIHSVAPYFIFAASYINILLLNKKKRAFSIVHIVSMHLVVSVSVSIILLTLHTITFL